MQQEDKYTVIVHSEDGSYWAEVQEMPGCFAAGGTLDELWEALPEAMGMWLSTPEEPVTVTLSDRDVVSSSEAIETRVLVG